MRELLGQAWTVARKDLVLEFRTRTALLSAVVFTALVLTVFNFGRDPTAVATIDLAPSILWVTFTFAAMLALNRAFQLELENGALEGLLVSPLSRHSLYLGKLLANLGFVGVVEAVGLPLFVLFFNVPVAPVLLPLIGVIALATVGFVSVGTLFSAMVVRTRFAELMLPVLLLPFLLLPLTYAVQATARLLAGRPLSEVSGWLSCSPLTTWCSWQWRCCCFPTRWTNESRAKGAPRRAGRLGAAGRRVCQGARVHAGRAIPGSRAEDLLPPRSRRRDHGAGGDPGGAGGRVLSLLEGHPARPVRGSLGGGRHGVRRDRADDGTHLGEADLGHVVDLGCPAHQYAVLVLPADQLSRAAERGDRRGAARALRRGARDLCGRAGRIHSHERVSVSDAPPPAHRAATRQARRASRDAGDATPVVRRVPGALRGLRDAALRDRPAARGSGFRCLRAFPRTPGTSWRRTSWCR